MYTVDIIVPVYNEEAMIELYWQKLCSTVTTLEDFRFNLIFIDDGSTDNTIKQIKAIMGQENELKIKVSYISFVANFGKESAIRAGLEDSRGDYVIVMDVDLQDPVELIPDLCEIITSEKLDVVYTARDTDSNQTLGICFSDMFNLLMGLPRGIRDYSIFTGEVRDRILTFRDRKPFFRSIIRQVTKSSKTRLLEFDYKDRKQGTSKWNLISLLNYSFLGLISRGRQETPLLFLKVALPLFLLIGVSFFLCKHFAILLATCSLLLYLIVILYYLDTAVAEIRNRPAYIIDCRGGNKYE